MRKALISLVIVSMIGSGVASARKGPSGSSEGRTASTNNVRCAKGTDAGDLMTVYAAQNGVELCSDGKTLPLQGRVIADPNKRYVALDGDRHNPEQARGYARLDESGVHCSKGRDQDSTRSKTGGDPTTCDGNAAPGFGAGSRAS